MSGWPRIYYKLLNLPLSILVKSKSIPADPAPELGLDTSRPIMYVLPYNSKADLLTLRAQCLAHDLPDPLEPLEIDGTLLPRYVFIHGGPRVFTYYTPKEESIKLFHDYLDLHRSNPNLDVQTWTHGSQTLTGKLHTRHARQFLSDSFIRAVFIRHTAQ